MPSDTKRLLALLTQGCALLLAVGDAGVGGVRAAAAGELPAHGGRDLVGTVASPFALPEISGDGYVDSDTLFEAYGATVLAFWTTHCAECTRRMERCQELFDWGLEDGLNVVGINFDEYPTSKTRLLAFGTGPRLMHLYDPGGRIASIYGAGAHSFSAFVVDGLGRIREVHHEIMPDGLAALRPSLERLLEEALDDDVVGFEPGSPAGPQVGESGAGVGRKAGRRPGVPEELGLLRQQRIELHGRGRLRWMHIDTTGTGAMGSHGEPLLPGASLRHRIELELSYAITPQLRAGGLIRLSNEGEMVLRSGPDYLSCPWGSLFIRYDARGRLPVLERFESSLTGGFYRIALTPFTLMRWDQDDTPISGGQRAQGCGVCGGAAGMAGFIRSESLEKLAPELSFEGARWNLSLGDWVDILTLYARPQTPRPEDPSDCGKYPTDETYYHQDLYVAHAIGNIPLPWGPELLEIGATAMFVNDDEDSPSCVGSQMRDPYSDRVLGMDGFLPLPYELELEGEVALSHWNPDKDRLVCHLDGSAIRMGAAYEVRGPADRCLFGISLKEWRARLEAAYQRIEEDFFSPYSALSYEPNLEGFRGSLRVDWGPVGLGGFFKLLKQIDVQDGPAYASPVTNEKTTWSLWVDAEVWPGGVFMFGGVFENRDLFDPDVGFDAYTGVLGPLEHKTLVVSIEQELAPRCTLMAEAEWLNGDWLAGVKHGDSEHEVTQDYTSTVVRVMMDVEF